MAAGTGEGAMSAPMSPDDIALHLGKMDDDLSYILEEAEVHPDIQARIVQVGFKGAALFAKLDAGEGVKGVREFIKVDLNIDPSAGGIKRATAGRIVLAWETAERRVATRNEHQAQQRAADGPKTILQDEYVSLCTSYTDLHGELDERLQSSQPYFESRLEQVEARSFVSRRRRPGEG